MRLHGMFGLFEGRYFRKKKNVSKSCFHSLRYNNNEYMYILVLYIQILYKCKYIYIKLKFSLNEAKWNLFVYILFIYVNIFTFMQNLNYKKLQNAHDVQREISKNRYYYN